ncbi:DUF1329 domain-containing protein [Zestomonas carbonaria]|uniref:DUF1329 domain-containing protein n=1 Tax=Zestomonas carbonaria TaxID=2762745 RepID=A0A7U7IB04_9GAMM|nr:DUF1329 domain-containing protein [Pseudomonas carbonaria]CAD5108417.1 hypothetical protein PSEWESI4_02702 [Pseudomonas carbonaria]
MKAQKLITALTLSLLAGSVLAAVSPEEAAKLGTSLTPLGAEKAGNADGSIPAWNGGLPKNAAPVDAKGFLGDPFANEKPLFTITAQNVDQYKDRLSEGQLAMFKRYADTYKMAVYPSHRTVAAPEHIYKAAHTSALKTTLVEGGNGLKNFTDSRFYAFPIPKDGLETVWNHITRYRGTNILRVSVSTAPQTNGDYTLIRYDDDLAVPTGMADLDPAKAENLLYYFKQRVTAPARLAGTVLLVHDTLDQVKEPRMAWQYNAGQRRVRRAPQVAYDSPTSQVDGLRVSDNLDMFNGAPNRYDWKLIGKQELYIPYNNYKAASPQVKYADLIKAGHTNQDLVRYEPHRVWVVEATLKQGERHVYAKRRFYIDEDSWTIAISEQYDGRGQLWRVGEAMLLQDYSAQVPWYAYETLYDLIAGRYATAGMMNEEKNWIRFDVPTSASQFTPAALRSAGVR